MAKGKAKKKAKTKGKVKAKAKPKAKVKAKVKAKAKTKTKSRAQVKAKARPRTRARQNLPPTVMPGMCDSFTTPTGSFVVWQNVPPGGCVIEQSGPVWPFNPGPPLQVYSGPGNPVITVTAGAGKWPFEVKCCDNNMPKNVTVP